MIDRKQLLTLLAVVALVANASLTGAAAVATSSGVGLNTSADEYPETRFAEDRLTIESHDRSSMDWLQYEDDNGKLQTIDAHVNGTESGAKVSYRADRLEAAAFAEYPRKDAEGGNNSASWIDTDEWSSTTGVSVTDSDGQTASGVDSITISTNGSFTSGNSASASYTNQSITDDVEKLYLQLVLNGDLEDSGANVEVQIRDGGGDYVATYYNESANGSDAHVIANQTANGIIFQGQLGQYDVQGSGDGQLDAVEEIRVVVSDGDFSGTITALNVQKKSRWDFGDERVPDTSTDTSDDYTDETEYNRPAGGAIEATGLADLGSVFSDAVVHKLTYLDVEYRMQDKPSAVSVEIQPEEDQYPNFQLMDLSYRRTIPTAYDISHGNITLETNQTFLSERYTQIRVAEGVGDTETEKISSSSWIDLSGSLGEKGTWLTADSTVSAGKTYVIQFEPKITDSQADALEQTQASGGGGFWGSSGGGNPFMSFYNWVAGSVVGLLAALGLAKRGS